MAVIDIRRAATREEIAPLVEFCKAGKLFDVQKWVAAGNPVNPPPLPLKGHRPLTPLEIAIESGFHSLVDVLLQAGACQEPDDYRSPMLRALEMRRMDLVTLLVGHGFDPTTIDMQRVFETWDPAIMAYFIERGADVERDRPFAYAFCHKIRTALGVYKQFRDRFPNLREQANVALRYHCKEGSLKWVSLMLWAGADPYAPGADDCGEAPDPDDPGITAVECAAIHRRFEVFGIKQLRLDLKHPATKELLYFLSDEEGFPLLKRLLSGGLDPNDQPDGGCSAIQSLIHSMDWDVSRYSWNGGRTDELLDTENARQKLKALHLLARHGAKWRPADPAQIQSARRSLLKLKPDYTAEFIWIMSLYRACALESVRALLGTPKMKAHIGSLRNRIDSLFETWPGEPAATLN